MAKNTDEKVMSLVEEELKKNPGTSTEELYEKAKGASPAIGKLTLRQFNARYPLQVKRRAGGRRKGRSRKTAKAAPKRRKSSASGDGREAVRDAFLRFATDMAGAEQRGQLVKVLASVDRYVDEVMKATGR
ncbi:MAG: hypothetical protein KY453_08500 [Gemmatimonadetes bacterium]|nr:hypothetical protein [Gemmatimonadota bacterium]